MITTFVTGKLEIVILITEINNKIYLLYTIKKFQKVLHTASITIHPNIGNVLFNNSGRYLCNTNVRLTESIPKYNEVNYHSTFLLAATHQKETFTLNSLLLSKMDYLQ